MGARTPRSTLWSAGLALAVAACAQAGATQAPAATPAPASIAATTRPTAPPPAPTPLNPAPAEMLGKWTAQFSEGDVARITITATRITIVRLGSADIRLEVFGDELVLSHSQLCVGEGRYRWSIQGDELRFDSVEPDACDGRSKSFDGVTYTRVQN
jgi:hypothetical protein